VSSRVLTITLLKERNLMTEAQLDKMKSRVDKLVWNKLDHEAKDEAATRYKDIKSMIKRTDDLEIREHLHDAKESASGLLMRTWDDAFIAVISETLASLDATRKLNRELTKKLSE